MKILTAENEKRWDMRDFTQKIINQIFSFNFYGASLFPAFSTLGM